MAGGTYDPNLTSTGLSNWDAGYFTGAPDTPSRLPEPGNTSPVIWDGSVQGLTWTYSTDYGGYWEANLPLSAVYSNVTVFGPDGSLAIATYGSISQVTVDPGQGGAGYQVGNILAVPDYRGDPGDAIVRVTAVGANGTVTGVEVPPPGDPIYANPEYSAYKNRDGYYVSSNGYQWSTQAISGSQGPSTHGSGCTLDIQAVTPATFTDPETVAGLTDANGNLLNDITWFDGTTLYFKPKYGESLATDNQGNLVDGQLHVVSSAIQNYFGGYTTILGINIRNVEDGIHSGPSDNLAIERDQFTDCNQGILFGGTNSLFQNNYIDMIGADYEWQDSYEGGGYSEGSYDHSLYLSGYNLTVNNNFSGQAPGLGLKGNDVYNSLFENNVVSDTESWFLGGGQPHHRPHRDGSAECQSIRRRAIRHRFLRSIWGQRD